MFLDRIAQSCLSVQDTSTFTTHVIANMSVAPFVSTTVEVPYPTDGTYLLNIFSPSGASTSFTTWPVTLIKGYFQNFVNFQPFRSYTYMLLSIVLHRSFDRTLDTMSAP